MKTYKKGKRKKKTYIILCCEILLIATLTMGIAFYAYSVKLREKGGFYGSESNIAVRIAKPKEERDPIFILVLRYAYFHARSHGGSESNAS